VDGLVTGVSVAAGLLIGDQLEIVVERLGQHQTLALPWWRCPSCGAALGPGGRIPLVRVGSRRRGCPSCAAAIVHPWRPLVLSVATGAVLGAFAATFGADVALAAYAVLGVALVAISAVDLERSIIPNRIVYPTLAAMVPLLVLASAVDHRWGSLARAAVAGAVAFAVFLVVHLAAPRGMGFGDVRLAGVVGVATGWLGYGHAFVAFLAAFALASVVGLGLMAVTGAGRKTRIPFGPFLAAGAVIAVVWGSPIASALFHTGSG
jgi:leader peptidase (prepilin peptidase) / N-methyltransferase